MADLLTLDDALTAGLRWLYDTEQPDNAWMQHHSQQIHAAGNRFLAFAPTSNVALPIVVIGVTKPTWKDGPHGPTVPANPLTPTELPYLAAELERNGYAVRSTWNGFPGHTGSVGLVRPAHLSQVAAVDRYRAGCQEHPARSVFCECDAWRAGFDRAAPPRPFVSA
ncbi:hypothetical protein ACWEP8_37235 [Streptomyces hydrogenans]